MAEQQTTDLPVDFRVDLSGQVALVTGASRGLGQAMALALGACGATVICVARDLEKLQRTVEAIRGAGGQAEALVCDVSDRARVDAEDEMDSVEELLA